MSKCYCEYCGAQASSVSHLSGGLCVRHPMGPSKGRHYLYQGNEKSQYSCKFCGAIGSSISHLTNGLCIRHPNGTIKGHHSPAL